MKRRHREIAGGEVAMMAVITKAMGAFLVLMILLLPYYTGDTKSQQTVDETKQRIDQAKAGLDAAVDKLKLGRLTDAEIDSLLKSLILARDELVEAQNLIGQLRIKIDQMASQINRLEQQNTALQDQVAQLQGELATLKAAVATLVADNLALKATVVDLTAKLSALEAANATLTQQNTELQSKINDIQKQLEALTAENTALKASVAELTAKVNDLEAANAKLTQENTDLRAEIERLKAFDPETLKARIKELEKQVDDITTKLNASNDANVSLTKQNAALADEIADLKKRGQFAPLLNVVSDCQGHPTLGVRPISVRNVNSDDFDDIFATRLMPWVTDNYIPNMKNPEKLDGKKIFTDSRDIAVSNEDTGWDIFLQLNLDELVGAALVEEAIQTARMSDGSIQSSENLSGCKATVFISAKEGNIELGTFQLGLIEPVVHVAHLLYLPHKEGRIFFAKDKRPEWPRHIANVVCGHYSLACALAKLHAEWRVRGLDPWVREHVDPADVPIIPQSPPQDDKSPLPEEQKTDQSAPNADSPPPPPLEDKTIHSSP